MRDMATAIGFTGTQNGMTQEQGDSVRKLLAVLYPRINVFNHGDCVGADSQAHKIARSLGYYIVLFPPIQNGKRAFCSADREEQPNDYLTRNRAIVRNSDIIIAAPDGPEHLRSGTWATVRHARFLKRELHIVHSNGDVV
jgi:hypothetical protein